MPAIFARGEEAVKDLDVPDDLTRGKEKIKSPLHRRFRPREGEDKGPRFRRRYRPPGEEDRILTYRRYRPQGGGDDGPRMIAGRKIL